MSYLIRYSHPTTHELIMRRQEERPYPLLKVPMYPRRSIFYEPEDRSRPVIAIAEYECLPVYTTPTGERIYDYWRIR